MSLTLSQLQALDALIQRGLDEPEASRRTWFDALDLRDPSTRSLLENALFPKQRVETANFLDRAPVIDADVAPEPDVKAGQNIGNYTLDALIGEGGSATVWRARRSDGALKRDVALKLPYFIGNTRGWHERVLRERDILASLQHPNIAAIYDAGVEPNGRPWLALELIEGERIDRFAKNRALSVDERVTLIAQVARTIEYAHARGVIHRDIKPGNILVDQSGRVKLLDFGIAKLLASEDSSATRAEATLLTQLHGRPFTPEYASPEQKRGEPITTSADVYALGVVLHELIAGERPELDADAHPTTQLTSDLPSWQAIGAMARNDLAAVAHKAVHPDRQRRYSTVNALADDLERFSRREAVSAQSDGRWYRLRRYIARHTLAISAATAVAAALMLGSALAMWQAIEARAQRAVALQEASKASAVKQFLVGLFESSKADQIDAERKRNTTLAQLVLDAENKVATAFIDQPDIKEEMLSVVGELHEELGLLDSALRLREQVVSQLSARNATPARQALALVQLATVHTSRDESDQAITRIDEAKRLLASATDPESLGALGEVLAQEAYARSWVMASDAQAVRALAERAIRLLETHRAKSTMIPVAYAALARSERLRRDFAAESAAWQRATDISIQRFGANSLSVADARLELSQSLFQQQRFVEAKTEADSVHRIVLQSAGPTSFAAAAAHLWAGRMASYGGEPTRAIELIEQGVRIHESNASVTPSNLETARAFLVEARLTHGHLNEAKQPALRSVARLLATPSDDRKNRAGHALFSYGLYTMQIGRYNEAVSCFERVVKLRSRPGVPDTEASLQAKINLANARILAGDSERGVSELRDIVTSSVNPVISSSAFAARWMLARFDDSRSVNNRIATLETLLTEAQSASDQTMGPAWKLRVVVAIQRAVAELLATTNLPPSSSTLAFAESVVAFQAMNGHADAPQLAHDRSLLALLYGAEDKRSASLRAMARASLSKTPEAGAHFSRWLHAFDQRVAASQKRA